MTDAVSKKTRSQIMRAIHSEKTNPELLLRNAFRANGIRGWKFHGYGIPGRPDFIFKEQKVAVFVDGCFWHGCIICRRVPKSNRIYWSKKIASNVFRDRKINAELISSGWKVARFWEHEVLGILDKCTERVISILKRRYASQKILRLAPSLYKKIYARRRKHKKLQP